ncbi:MAG: type ISP restriction/modification enzyme, partial [Bacteroidales bacterium]
MTDFEKYFKSLQSQKIADITEHSHRSNLQQLLESLAGTRIKILHEPKREGKFGSPDFKITFTESIIGYVENKKIEETLDKILKSDQIKKYQALSDNILLTNYIDWIWIKEGKIQQRETLCFLTDIENKKAKLDKAKVTAVEKLIKSFFSQAPKEIADAKKLAQALAIRAKLLKDFLLDELKRQEQEHTEGRLYQLYETFRTFVFHELTTSEFSDAFAQNLVYGLFLAKLNADIQTINLYNAKKYIPTSFELIRELVNFLDELDNEEYRETKWIVEEVLTIMNNLDLRAIHESLSFTKKRKDAYDLTIKDPYVYFYEDFLAAYDKKLREAKGVYYTPPPVVNFIVRAIDDILVNTFKIKDGLADRTKVTVLDFATGTGTFLVEVLQQIFEKLPKGSGKKDLLIKEHILKNIFGFEYLIAPYTIAHIKLSQFLKDNGYDLEAKERLQIFLTNTLDPIDIQQKIAFLPALTEESKLAQKVKDKPILVITGNPPYSNYSTNKGSWIDELLNEYKKGLNEKKINLDDDYIKFIRFAQDKMEYRIEYEGNKKKRVKDIRNGIIGIITNNSFLDGITHRQMRKSLLDSFEQIYILNLHGYYLGTAPDGSKDENVFDIRQGVTISFFIKNENIKEKGIYYAELFGHRIDKYKQLFSLEKEGIDWKKLKLDNKYYFFKPFDYAGLKRYEQSFKVSEIFQKYGTGVKTDRDELFFDLNKDTLIGRIETLLNNPSIDFKKKYNVKDSSSYKLTKKIQGKKIDETLIVKCNYRPFDLRYLYYDTNILSRPNSDTFQHILNKKNLVLTVKRQNKFEPFSYAFILDKITESCFFESSFANNSIFPLYLYSGEEKKINFSKIFSDFVKEQYKSVFEPEEILAYIYAILHSQTYRSKYAEFLK